MMADGVLPMARRVVAIAGNTFTESLRQRVFNILLVFALAVLASAAYFRSFSFAVEEAVLRFVKDFCLGAISVFGTLLAIVATAQMIPGEIERRTIYTILAKPVRRFEFLLGKYLGSVWLLLCSTIAMTLVFVAMLWITERGQIASLRAAGLAGSVVELPAEQEWGEEGIPDELAELGLQGSLAEEIALIRYQSRDPNLLKALLLVFVKICLVAAIVILISTFSGSVVFTVVLSVLVFFAGHLQETARLVWAHGEAGPVPRLAMGILAFLLPDLTAFNVADEVVVGSPVPGELLVRTIGYGLLYIGGALALAWLIFSEREI